MLIEHLVSYTYRWRFIQYLVHSCNEATPLHTCVRTGFCCLIGISVSPSVCLSQCVCNIGHFYLLRELFEADFHEPGIFGSGTAWANPCDVLPRIPSRARRGRLAAVAFVVCVGWGGFFSVFFL